MDDQPLGAILRQFDFDLNGTLKTLDVSDRSDRRIVERLKLLLTQLRAGIYAYEYADSGDEQLAYAAEVRDILGKMQKQILTGANRDLFSGIFVAQAGATIEHLQARIGQ